MFGRSGSSLETAGTVDVSRQQCCEEAGDVGGRKVAERMTSSLYSPDIYSSWRAGRRRLLTGPDPAAAVVARLDVGVELAACCGCAVFISESAPDSIAAPIQIKSGMAAAAAGKWRPGAGCDGVGDVLCISGAGILDCPCFILQA